MTTYIAAGPLVNYFFYNAPTTQDGPNIPLDGGKIYFYDDSDHSVHLNSYSDVFDVNNPVVNPWPLILGAAGECGIIYLEDRVYYIEIYDKNNVFQRSISHYSPGDAASGSANDAVNYIPNGQFLLHNDLPKTGIYQVGEIRAPVTNIAYGGWTFERSSASTAQDFVIFTPEDEYITNPVSNPRWFCNIKCNTSDSGDAYKRLCVTFPNVNRFASTSQQYTVAFSGIDNLDQSTTIELYVIKNFGTGGSPQTETLIETFTLTSVMQNFYVSFIYGANTGQTIGPDKDDFLQLAFSFKTDESFDVNVVDLLQESGEIIAPNYPETPNRQDVQTSLGGGFNIPNPDGSDLYLPVRLTPTGLEFDKSGIGKISQCAYPLAKIGELICDGSKYEYSLYSSDGIPYYRLGDVIWNSTINAFQFGTGSSFVTTINIAEHFRLTTNSAGAVTNPSDGTPATGFTFTNIHTGNSTYDFSAYYSSSAVIVTQNVAGAFTASNANTSGFTLVDYINVASVNGVILITGITSVAGLAGKYFTVHNTTQGFYPWFKVDGVGTDPAPGGGLIGIEIDLLSTFSTAELAQSISEALSGKQNFIASCVAASAIPAGAYWSFNTTPQPYYVWYEKDDVGTDPAPGGKIGIKVSISSSDTNAQVSLKTSIAINKKYYAVPDLRDMFIRGIDNGRGLDPDVAYRFNLFSNSFGNQIGTIELDEFLSHTHTINPINLFSAVTAPFGTDDIGGGDPSNPLTGALIPSANYSGGKETRPLNIYLNYVIQY